MQLSPFLKYIRSAPLFTLKRLQTSLSKQLLQGKLRPQSLTICKLQKRIGRNISVSCPNFDLKYKTISEISHDFKTQETLGFFVVVVICENLFSCPYWTHTDRMATLDKRKTESQHYQHPAGLTHPEVYMTCSIWGGYRGHCNG